MAIAMSDTLEIQTPLTGLHSESSKNSSNEWHTATSNNYVKQQFLQIIINNTMTYNDHIPAPWQYTTTWYNMYQYNDLSFSAYDAKRCIQSEGTRFDSIRQTGPKNPPLNQVLIAARFSCC